MVCSRGFVVVVHVCLIHVYLINLICACVLTSDKILHCLIGLNYRDRGDLSLIIATSKRNH